MKELSSLYVKEDMKRLITCRINHEFLTNLALFANLGATELYRYGLEAYENGDFELAKKCEVLNKVINNCSIKSTCKIGKGSKLAYGGIGTLIHPTTIIGEYCTLGVGVTLGNSPIIENYVYISTGARIIRNKCHVESFSIIGANAVVRNSIAPYTIVAGVPAKEIKKITPKNIDKYLEYFCAYDKTDKEFREETRTRFLNEYRDYMER